MSYVTLYRKYRPKCFADVVGQQIIVKTLQNSLLHDRINHAYLFYGPRGTGKTSIAKIFSKAVNCHKMPALDACLECSSCLAIDNDSYIDISEIDAASNNGVDEIRQLKDSTKYIPILGKYKVFIIDEVHMLSTAAFNALLKILEEPPKHIIFILATTEYHKLPSTIISRCQCFEFKNVSNEELYSRLSYICQAEKITISDEALKIIINNSQGGVRDAISYLDQAFAYTSGKISEEDVNLVTGAISVKSLIAIFGDIYAKNTSLALEKIESLVDSGKSIGRIAQDMIEILKELLIFKVNKSKTLATKYIDIVDKFNTKHLEYYLSVLNRLLEYLPVSPMKKSLLDLAIIELCTSKESNEIANSVEIERLKNQIKILNDKFGSTLPSSSYAQNISIPPIVSKQIIETKKVASSLVPLVDDTILENIMNESDKELRKGLEKKLKDYPNKQGLSNTLVSLLNSSLLFASPSSFVIYGLDIDQSLRLYQKKSQEAQKIKKLAQAKPSLFEVKFEIKDYRLYSNPEEDIEEEDLITKAKNRYGSDLVNVLK